MKTKLLSILFLVATTLGLSAETATAAPAPESSRATVAAKIELGSDCTGYANATKISSTQVKVRWELYCYQNVYFYFEVAPVLVKGGKTIYFDKHCYETDHCVFSTTVNDPAGKQQYWLTWDPAPHGSGVYFGDGEVRCGQPSKMYCGNFNANF